MYPKSVLLSTLFVVAFSSMPHDYIFSQDLMAAHEAWVNATRQMEVGNYEKAEDFINEALEHAPDNLTYLVDAACIFAATGRKNDALECVEQIQCTEGCNDAQNISALIHRGNWAIHLGEFKLATGLFDLADELMIRYSVKDDGLACILRNNLAICRLFGQGFRSDTAPCRVGGKHQVHRCDVEVAFKNLIKAVELDPSNCQASCNLAKVEHLLSLFKESNDFGYLPCEGYKIEDFPECDCVDTTETRKQISFEGMRYALKSQTNLRLSIVRDFSGSTLIPIDGTPTSDSRHTVAIKITNKIFEEVDSVNCSFSAISVEGDCFTQPLIQAPFGTSPSKLKKILESTAPGGLTPLNERLKIAIESFPKEKTKQTKVLMLITDGINTCTDDSNLFALGELANQYGIKVFVFSLLREAEAFREVAVFQLFVKGAKGTLFEIKDLESVQNRTAILSHNPISLEFVPAELLNGTFEPKPQILFGK